MYSNSLRVFNGIFYDLKFFLLYQLAVQKDIFSSQNFLLNVSFWEIRACLPSFNEKRQILFPQDSLCRLSRRPRPLKLNSKEILEFGFVSAKGNLFNEAQWPVSVGHKKTVRHYFLSKKNILLTNSEW